MTAPVKVTKYMGKSVNPNRIEDYEEFRRHPDPFDLSDDLASLRTLIVEFRQSISDNNQERRIKFAQSAALATAKALRDSPLSEEWFPDQTDRIEFSKAVAQILYKTVPQVYVAYFGECTRITPEEAKVMASLIDTAGKLTERHRKMLEEKKLTVTFDNQMIMLLMKFMAEVVAALPRDYRPIVAETARGFFSKIRATGYEVVG